MRLVGGETGVPASTTSPHTRAMQVPQIPVAAPKPTPLPPHPVLAQAQTHRAHPPLMPTGDALIGGELIALAVEVGELAVGAKIK